MTPWPPGVDRQVFETVDSTNAEARRRADAGEAGPVWLAAHRQTLGRGRQGRAWSSEPGNLAATLLTAFDAPPAAAARLSFATALAVADTVDTLAPGLETRLKWPNDVLARGGKIAGILLENFGPAPGTARPLRLAIGIGLNLAHHPPAGDAPYPPTSIGAHTGQAPGFDQALAALAFHTAAWLARADDFPAIRAAWRARAIGLGQSATARLPNETIEGRVIDLDADGALVLETGSGSRRIAAGDVFFPGDV